MSRFAPVAPLEVAREMKNLGCLGNYHLLLAHDVLAHPNDYAEVYGTKQTNDEDPQRMVIMDNSLIELGKAMNMHHVLEAAQIVGARYIVLPDALGDYQKTLMDSTEALMELGEPPEGIRPMIVVQGRRMSEYLSLVDFAIANKLAIAVPRDAVKRIGTRMSLLMNIHSRTTQSVHLLGFSDNVLDDICCARMSNVMGIDSAVPVRAALEDLIFTLDHEFSSSLGGRKNYWEKPFRNCTEDLLEQRPAADDIQVAMSSSRADLIKLIAINVGKVRDMISIQAH